MKISSSNKASTNNRVKFVFLGIISLVLVGCAAPNKEKPTELSNSLKSSQSDFEYMVNSLDTRKKVLEQYASWKGVKYRLGGSSRKGIDCSGFVQLTFKEQFNVTLPRSTYEQEQIGKKVANKKELVNGDVVVFNAGSTGRHVGIYIGDNKFVHASTSQGVIISDMNNSYWKNRFREARRVLNTKGVKSASNLNPKSIKDKTNKALFNEKTSKNS